jgi:fumarylacetoacetate (FAA) hydrolase family protein
VVNSSFPSLNETLPLDAANALLIGRIWVPGEGPYLVKVGQHEITDLSELALTSSDLMELEHAADKVAKHSGRTWSTPSVWGNTDPLNQNPKEAWFLAPTDLQAIKAAGVTFVASMLERVIEEQARGDAAKAESVRTAVISVMGDNLRNVKAWFRSSHEVERSFGGARCLVAVFGGGHWPRRRNFHQVTSHERGRLWL